MATLHRLAGVLSGTRTPSLIASRLRVRADIICLSPRRSSSVALVQRCMAPRSSMPARLVRASSSMSTQGKATELGSEAYQSLVGKQAYLVSTQQPVGVTSLWGEELAMQLNREVLPVLSEKGVKLYMITIGTPESGLKFVENTGFPADRLLADPDSSTYASLGFAKGLKATFFSVETGRAIQARREAGKDGDIKAVMKKYVPLMPPKMEQAFQQGGVLIFKGPELVWSHFDPSTAAHADLDEVIKVATEGL